MSLQFLTSKDLRFPSWITPLLLIISLFVIFTLKPFGSSTSSRASLVSECFIDTTAVINELQPVMPNKTRVEIGEYLVQEYSTFTRQLIIKGNGSTTE